jgi:hypothetical protein
MNFVLETIIELQSKYKDSKNYLTSNQVRDLLNTKKGFFDSQTVWNHGFNERETNDIKIKWKKCLYGFKSGFVFMDGEEVVGDSGEMYLLRLGSIKKFDYEIRKLNIRPHLHPDDDYVKYSFISPENIILEGNILKLNLETFLANAYDWYEILLEEDEREFFSSLKTIINQKEQDKINETRLKVERKEKNRLESLKKSQTSFLQEFDKDGNGVVDAIEGVDDFMILFKKHQKKIIDVDKQYIQNFVKVSNYLKTKRQNIQDIFSSIKNTENQLQLNENVGILKNQIHTYELLLFHSLNMIISIVKEDLIIFYEIYESFDKLNMFSSNWENEVAQQLENIEDGFSELMHSIDFMGRNIVSGLNQLTYVTQEGFSDLERSVTKELHSIDSSIKFNNLLTGISTYQLYKINKQTKPLLPK